MLPSTAANGSLFMQTIMFVVNQSIIQQPQLSYNSYFVDIGVEMNGTKCYGSYGCFKLTPPWTNDNRPVSVFPEDIQKIQPEYFLYNRKHLNNPAYIDLNEYDVIKASGINPHLPLYVVSHGFMESSNKQWIKDLKYELLKREDCSVIVINWEGGSSPPYTQAVANIRLVGAMTAHLLANFATYTDNKNLDHVHCIGHSLGAHLSGYVGYTLQKDFKLMLGRITGLDPAHPHFAKNQPPVRLDRSAAKYVDVIHTDASGFIRGGFGIIERIGHVDYYPNGGINQPGCTQSVVEYISVEKSFFTGVKKYLGCNHVRSYEFFIESINTKCAFMTISCSSYEDFKVGKCFKCGANGNQCIKFGFHGKSDYDKHLRMHHIHPKQNLVQYLMTNDRSPFCKAHFRITVTISNSEESIKHRGEIGLLWFSMHSTTDGFGPKSNRVPLNGGGYHAPGETYQFVVPAEGVQKLKAVEVEWQYNSVIFNPLTWRILSAPKVHVEKVHVVALETNERITVCPKDGKPLITGIPQMMVTAYCI